MPSGSVTSAVNTIGLSHCGCLVCFCSCPTGTHCQPTGTGDDFTCVADCHSDSDCSAGLVCCDAACVDPTAGCGCGCQEGYTCGTNPDSGNDICVFCDDALISNCGGSTAPGCLDNYDFDGNGIVDNLDISVYDSICHGSMMAARAGGGTARFPPRTGIPHGPGTELERLLASLGVAAEKCGCKARARQMDAWAVEGCRARLDVIAGWLRDGLRRLTWQQRLDAAARAASLGLWFNPLDPAPGVAAEAIRRAEAKQRGV